MANDLTGEFDVVAEFSVPAANRVLAAMHRCERFPHSMSVRVDDNPPPGSRPGPVIVGSVDAFGDVIANQNHVGKPNPWPGPLAATSPIYAGLDVLVNAGASQGTITPSHLQGVAQVQLAPPTMEVPDASGANLTVRMSVMARYFPDPKTAPISEFVRGDLLITAPVNQVVSPDKKTINVIDIDITGDQVTVNFDAKFPTTLSPEDSAGINLLLRNALKTSFLPSNATLPDRVKYLQLKTLPGPPSAIGVLLDLGDSKGNPASMTDVFIDAADDFGFAVGSDFIAQRFKQLLNIQLPSENFLSYTISFNAPKLELQNDRIVLTITGHAHSSVLPDFDFTLGQAFTLNLASTVPGGPFDTAVLAVSGDIFHDVSGLSFLFDWIANDFLGWALDPVRQQRDSIVSMHQPDVMDLFSVDKNLGGFLKSLLNPARRQPGVPPPQDVSFVLAYTSLKIGPSGIVFHGSLGVTAWPPAHVEYQPIPSKSGGGQGLGTTAGVSTSQDYSALKSWIPGGIIERFEWAPQGLGGPAIGDTNKFVLLDSPRLAGYSPMCLTISGSRLSFSGPVVPQPVTATVCGYNSFPVVNGLNVAQDGTVAMVALAQRGPNGFVHVAGHTAAQVDPSGRNTPNVIAHIEGQKSAGNLEVLTQALRESGRTDATTAVLAVLPRHQLTQAPYIDGVVYGDAHGGAWERIFGLKTKQRPVTLIVGPSGKVVWQQEGKIDAKTLAAALRKSLAARGPVQPRMLGLNLPIGRQAPNFLFELAPGHSLTLRKLGRSAILVFISTSKQSIDAVRDLQNAAGKAGGQGPIVDRKSVV